MNRLTFISITFFTLPFVSACERFSYGVDILNYGESGVIILQVGNQKAIGPHPAYVKIGATVPMIAARFPSIPSNYRDPASYFGRFEGYETSLPESIEVAWQLAALDNCKEMLRIDKNSESALTLRENFHGRTEYFAKSGCTCLLYTSPSPRDRG